MACPLACLDHSAGRLASLMTFVLTTYKLGVEDLGILTVLTILKEQRDQKARRFVPE